jgi:hypothetical protein
MNKESFINIKNTLKNDKYHFLFSFILVLIVCVFIFPQFFGGKISYHATIAKGNILKESLKEKISNIFTPLDKNLYDAKVLDLANNPPPKPPVTKTIKDPKTGVLTTVTIEPKPVTYLWPVKTVYPNDGAILPFNRIVAYYGNLYSKKMGVLGQYPEEEMLAKLEIETKKWELADPNTPVTKALHYIAVVAQGSAGKDGKYRFRMPDTEIEKVLKMAEKVNAIVFLDIQVGFSNLQTEVPYFEKYLKMPNVHLGIDAEFSMKTGVRPGKVVGTLDATDINFTAEYLAKIVKENNLPPKVLIVHRYTQKMITNYQNIKPLPEVQIVMHMDGWGVSAKKFDTYKQFVHKEPVQFAGFKLFYNADTRTPGSVILSPEELLKLSPKPIYIQYQ